MTWPGYAKTPAFCIFSSFASRAFCISSMVAIDKIVLYFQFFVKDELNRELQAKILDDDINDSLNDAFAELIQNRKQEALKLFNHSWDSDNFWTSGSFLSWNSRGSKEIWFRILLSLSPAFIRNFTWAIADVYIVQS